jgi:hypothetical protein
MKETHYRHLIAMAALSFVAMYILMYAMVNTIADVYMNVNQVYMAGLMIAPMIVIELLVMRGMYHNTNRATRDNRITTASRSRDSSRTSCAILPTRWSALSTCARAYSSTCRTTRVKSSCQSASTSRVSPFENRRSTRQWNSIGD